MNRRALLSIKIAWVVAMLGVLAWFMTRHWSEFTAYTGLIEPSAVATAVAFLCAGKLLLTQLTREALSAFGARLSFRKAFIFYSLSQLGKYLPGSVWQFVGRVVLYRGEGLAAREGTKLLIIENLWLLGSACAVGIATAPHRLFAFAGVAEIMPALSEAIIAAASLIALLGTMTWGTRVFAAYSGNGTIGGFRVFFISVGIWALLGASFWMLFPPESRHLEMLLLAISAFALGWAGGCLVPFAPAGIGVREAIIVMIVGSIMPAPLAVAAAALSRLIYSATDIVLGTLAAGWYRRGSGDLKRLLESAASNQNGTRSPIGSDRQKTEIRHSLYLRRP